MKNQIRFVLVLLCALFTTSGFARDLKGWNVHPENYPVSKGMAKFGDLIAAKTHGNINPKTYNGAQLGTQDQAIQQIQFGGIDFAEFNLIPLNNVIVETQVATLPYIFKSLDHMHRILNGPVGQKLASAMEKYNMVPLAWYDGGSRSFYASKPLNSLADFKGLKFRVQSSDINIAMVNALGAKATPLPFSEVYTSIQSGVVDGAENNWPSYESQGHYEVAPYYITDEHAIIPEVLVINKSVWESLSAEEQAIFRQAAKTSAQLEHKLWAARAQKSEAIVRKAGVHVVELKDKTPFIKAMQPVYDQFIKTQALKDLVKAIQQTQ